ncbi:MAG TPA: phospholipid carrier-dependent glycosyltransferase [Egicoccus sp.]|nr:phospholipid carrier-dependent glycosyltransferase [Egicoccus sp.]HSK22532.1 phospholipid carrier-dependent glycosyltransferase [Egicoccus sp.]
MRRTWPTWLVPTAVLLAGIALLVARLGEPADIVFDETYYVEDARSMLDTALEDGFAVHPPLGKWIIAGGIAAVGDTPVGWRISGALAGALTAMLTALIVRRLTGRDALGGLAGVLLLLDGVFVVQARTAMLDIHLAMFVVLGTWLLLVDRDRADAGATGPRWWLLGAGAAFGAAVAVKWSGAWALVGAGLLLLVWERARLRRDGRTAGAAAGVGTGRVAVFLGVVPVVVYALTWAPWVAVFANTTSAPDDAPAHATYSIGERLTGLVDHHRKIMAFHLNLEAEHPYRAPASTWPLQQRPVVFHYEACTDTGVDGDGDPCVGPAGRTSEIVAVGNLALWWGLLPLLPLLLGGVVRRDRRAGLPLTMLLAQFLPWLVVARPVFSFYAVPLVPFVVVGLAVACDHLDRPARRLGVLAGSLAGAGLAAAAATAAGTLGGSGVATDRIVIAACLGAAVGAVTGTTSDRRLEAREGAPVRFRHGSALAVVVALAAVVLFGYFAPVWYGIPLPDETVRSRWWFDGWI